MAESQKRLVEVAADQAAEGMELEQMMISKLDSTVCGDSIKESIMLYQ